MPLLDHPTVYKLLEFPTMHDGNEKWILQFNSTPDFLVWLHLLNKWVLNFGDKTFYFSFSYQKHLPSEWLTKHEVLWHKICQI